MRVQLVIKPANEQSHAKHPLKQIASLGDARVLEFLYTDKKAFSILAVPFGNTYKTFGLLAAPLARSSPVSCKSLCAASLPFDEEALTAWTNRANQINCMRYGMSCTSEGILV